MRGPGPAAHVGRIVADGEFATLEFHRRFPQPPSEVWTALTDPEALRQWFLPVERFEPRTGGAVEFLAGPSQMQITGRILTWDPPRVLEHEWKIAARPQMPFGENAVIRWELRPDGDGTVLHLTHARVSRRTARGIAPGIHANLDLLAAHLDRRPLPDVRERYTQVAPLYSRTGASPRSAADPPTE